jgi:hypothetical protein
MLRGQVRRWMIPVLGAVQLLTRPSTFNTQQDTDRPVWEVHFEKGSRRKYVVIASPEMDHIARGLVERAPVDRNTLLILYIYCKSLIVLCCLFIGPFYVLPHEVG